MSVNDLSTQVGTLDNGEVVQLLGTRCDPYGMNQRLTSTFSSAK